MQINIRSTNDNTGHYVDHILATDAEYCYLAKAFKDHPHSCKWMNPSTRTITILVVI